MEASRRLPQMPMRLMSVAFSAAALLALGWGFHEAAHSPLFLVQVVEMSEFGDQSPVDAQSIIRLAGVEVGKVNLFELDLKEIEERILSHPWIRSVQLEKRFPQTVAITPIFREPEALIQLTDGKLGYVDSTGHVFGRVTVGVQSDLPVLSGRVQEGDRILTALRIIRAWASEKTRTTLRMDSIDYDVERGFRFLVTYTLAKDHRRGRAMVDFGLAGEALTEEQLLKQLSQLKSVLQYLSKNGIQARQIWANIGKKIVVKIARGS